MGNQDTEIQAPALLPQTQESYSRIQKLPARLTKALSSCKDLLPHIQGPSSLRTRKSNYVAQ